MAQVVDLAVVVHQWQDHRARLWYPVFTSSASTCNSTMTCWAPNPLLLQVPLEPLKLRRRPAPTLRRLGEPGACERHEDAAAADQVLGR